MICIPEIIRETTSRWISDVPSKMVKILRWVWTPTFKRAGLTYTNRQDGMHAMRHLYASILLARGVSVKELADFLGHEDPGFTLRTYTHLMPSSHQRARLAVDGYSNPMGQGVRGQVNGVANDIGRNFYVVVEHNGVVTAASMTT